VVEKTLGWTRLVPVPVKLEDLKPDIVFSTHDHIDHLDPEATPEIARYYPSCLFAGPESVTVSLKEMSIKKVFCPVLEYLSKRVLLILIYHHIYIRI